MSEHTFAVCAYKESRFLEECILSLKNQTVKTDIIVATSTPNDFIKNICKKYNLPLYINEGEGGITQDWNFAYNKAKGKYITIAHQDDVYNPRYVEYCLQYMKKRKKPLLFFTDYQELRNGRKVAVNKLLRIKRLMLLPLRCSLFWNSRFVRRRILSLGSPICCPSVTFVRDNVMNPVFLHHFRAAEDWEAWERISRLKGAFLYCAKPLTYHRIHDESETTAVLAQNLRGQENYEMYLKF